MSVTLPILKNGDKVYFHPHWGGPFSVAKCIIRKAETYIDSKGEYNVRYYIRYCKPFEGYSQSPYTFDKSNPSECDLFLTAEECLAHNVEQYKKNVMHDIESLKKECKRCNIDFNEPIKLIQ